MVTELGALSFDRLSFRRGWMECYDARHLPAANVPARSLVICDCWLTIKGWERCQGHVGDEMAHL